MSERIRVLLVDDDVRARALVRAVIETTPDITIVAEVSSGTSVVSSCRLHQPDVVLMDVCMPGMDGVEATRQIRRAESRARVLALTSFALEESVLGMVRAGASGFIYKSELAHSLVPALRAVAAGQGFLSPAATPTLLGEVRAPVDGPRADDVLTPRELTMLRRVGEGLSNRAIAEQEGIAVATVKTHLTRILEKLGVARRSHLVRHAIVHGLVSRNSSEL